MKKRNKNKKEFCVFINLFFSLDKEKNLHCSDLMKILKNC